MDSLLLCFIFLLSHEISFFFRALWQTQKPVLFGIIISHSCEQEPFYSASGCETQADFKDGEESRSKYEVENSVRASHGFGFGRFWQR